MGGRESDDHASKYVQSFPPLLDRIFFWLPFSFCGALILFLSNALSSFFFNPFLSLKLFCGAVFMYAGDFNCDLSTWEVGKVTDMYNSTYTLSSPSPRSGLCLAASISPSSFSVAALIIFLNNALSSFFFQSIFNVGLFFVAVWYSVSQCCCLQW